jgi:hypothetical protein
MARWENENLEGLNLPDPEKKVYMFFGAGGKESKEGDAFMKTVDNSGFMTYYIKLVEETF